MNDGATLAVVAFYCITVAPQQTIANATVADEKTSGDKHEAADGARLALEEEAD